MPPHCTHSLCVPRPQTMHIGMPDQAFSGINVHHVRALSLGSCCGGVFVCVCAYVRACALVCVGQNPMKGSRSGSIASRFGLGSTANSSANSNGLITSPYAGSGPPSTMTQDSFSLTGFVSSGNAEFSISIPKQSSSAKQREGSIVSPAPSRGDRVALEAKRATQADAGRRS